MTVQKNKSITTAGNKRVAFINELASLLLVSGKTAGIPEPRYSNQSEDVGSYLVYLSELAKQSDKSE